MTGPTVLLTADDPRLAVDDDIAAARAVVAAFDPPSALEEQHRATVLDFVDRHPDALHRTCVEGHLTGSAWVVDHLGERALLLLHAKLGLWLQPGGHADGDANLAAVALREATEETGVEGLAVHPVPIDVDVHGVSPPAEQDHLHLDVRYLVVAPPGAVLRGNHESHELRWVRPDEVEPLVSDASTARLAGLGFGAARRVLRGGPGGSSGSSDPAWPVRAGAGIHEVSDTAGVASPWRGLRAPRG